MTGMGGVGTGMGVQPYLSKQGPGVERTRSR